MVYKKILVPLDGSECAEAALEHACALADCTGAELMLLRVASQPVREYLSAAASPGNGMRDNTEAECEAYIERVAADLRAAGFTVTAETCAGPVAETILEYAQGVKADLLVMSTHGQGNHARWFLGSVADKVLRAGSLPVLLARPRLY